MSSTLSSSSFVVYGRARQQDLEADLREEGQPNRRSWSRSTSSRMASMVKTSSFLSTDRGRYLYWVDAALGALNWALLPEGAYTGARLAAWISSNFATATCGLALGARGSSRGTARTALRPRRPQMRSGANWFELNKLLSIEK